MDKSYDSSAPPLLHSISKINNKRDQSLKQLNKLSHKISKPRTRRNTNSTTFDNHQPQIQLLPRPPLSDQPPVYNIKKSDFREVVQKLTGSPAHDRFSSPPPIPQPKQPSSRLQRIRPPPLTQIVNHPSPLINNVALLPHPHPTVGGFLSNFRPPPPPSNPLSPLPPFPSVYMAAAQSPISAYIHCFLQDSVSTFDSDPKQYHIGLSPLEPLITPRWNNINGHNLPPNESFVSAPVPSLLIPPFSTLPFGCISPIHSPGQPSFPQFPPSFI